MKLTIISLKRKDEHEIAWIEANTVNGNVVIQPGHAPTTYVLVPDKECVYCLKTGKHETLIIEKTSLLHIDRTAALLLLD